MYGEKAVLSDRNLIFPICDQFCCGRWGTCHPRSRTQHAGPELTSPDPLLRAQACTLHHLFDSSTQRTRCRHIRTQDAARRYAMGVAPGRRNAMCGPPVMMTAFPTVPLISLGLQSQGEQPACSSCRKRNAKCSYVNIPASMLVSSPWAAMDLSPFVFSIPAPGASESLPLAAPDDTLFQTFVGPDLGSTPVAVTDPWDTLLFDSISPLPLSPPGSEGPHSDQAPLQSGPEPENPNLDWIPSDDTAAEIVDLFFERVQWYFPLFHHKSLIASVKTGELRKSCPLLLYSIMAVAARGHPNPSIRAAHVTFHKKSQALYEVTTHVPDRPLETLQAACCIVLQAFILGDHSNAAFVLSKAWRQTVALGFHHLDTSSRVVLPGITAPDTSEWRESEQRRRALWALFVMDRAMCFKAGLVHTIDDRQISVFLPMREDAFQNSETVLMPPAFP